MNEEFKECMECRIWYRVEWDSERVESPSQDALYCPFCGGKARNLTGEFDLHVHHCNPHDTTASKED